MTRCKAIVDDTLQGNRWGHVARQSLMTRCKAIVDDALQGNRWGHVRLKDDHSCAVCVLKNKIPFLLQEVPL